MLQTAMVTYRGKRVLDIIITATSLIICLPLMFLIFSIILLLSGEKPFFIQERVGLNEKTFRLIKFKTMFPSRNRLLYKTGLFFRKYSLDELPQLLHVIRGDMSLVGPRPLLTEYLPLYNGQQRKRHSIRPGISGWAQINGRNKLAWEKKFALDVWYVNNLSLTLDLKIIVFTLFSLLNPADVKPEGLSEEEKFKGNQNYI